MDKVGSLDVSWIQGASSLDFVDDKTVCYMCGCHICFLDLETKKQRMFHCDVKGIGVLTANGHSGVFVFSEHKLNPSIFVYSFPKIELKNELKGSAQFDYTSIALCDGGPYLSCHSTFPDYTITVWNWQKGEKLCCHENERDVVSLEFNPLNWSQFCALGTEHVTVWTIEKSEDFHVLKPRMIELPAIEISLAEIADHLGLEASSSVVKAELIVTELTPTAICWTATSELYVGCAQGFLLLADPQSHSVTVLYNPRSPNAIPELRQSRFLGITLDKDGLIAVGREDLLHRLKIKGTQINITQTWILESAICSVKHSLDYETFLMSTDTGHIFLLKPHQSDEIVRFPWVSSSNFVAAAMLRTDKNICLSLKQCGKLQLWSPHGDLLGIMYHKTETRTLACCPVAQCAAIGTASGSVHIIDLCREDHPRVVHKVHLYHTPVESLVYDQGGNFLLGASDRHVHVLHAKPSKGFSVIGYTVVPGSILSLTTQYIREPEQVRVLALCRGESGQMTDGSLLTLFTLPVDKLAEPDCVDRNGRLCSEILKVRLYEVPHPIQACVLGINRFFAYCHKKKLIQRFPLPQNTEGVSSQQVVRLTPDQEASGHPLGPASLVLSPHNIWLASVGRDGLLRIRETSAMEQHIEVQCHSYRGGGVKDVSFSADSQTLLTTGYSDGSVVCLFIKITGDDSRIKEATQYSLAMGSSLKSMFDAENLVLATLPDWDPESCVETQEIEEQPEAETHGVTHEDEAPPCTPPSERTWMENRQEAVVKEDNEYYSETKESLKKTVQVLRDTLQAMMAENQSLPERERLKHEEFDMGGEENKILEEIANKLREEIEMKISKNCYLYDVVKRDIWDSMTVKYKTITAFQLKQGVKNYPLREPPEEELKELRRVQNMRKLEMATSTPSAAVKQLQESLKKRAKTGSKEEEELREGGQEGPCASLTETYSDLLGYTNPYIYSQLELTTTERRINQIYLLQDLIYHIRARFNTDFEVLHKQKIQVINGMRERNRQIRQMMMELGINETLWEPSLECMEQPEILLHVDDSEIKAEKYLTPEEKKQEKARKKSEDEKRLAAEGDNLRVRALDNMMGGALEGKKEDVLKMEIPLPEFVSTKPENEWDEDEKKAYEDYEKKTMVLDERKEAYKKSLEAELKKLQATNKDSTERFDENLRKLAQKKLKCQMAIFQERLKIIYLIQSVMQENKMRHRHEELRLQREKMTAHMNQCSEEVTKHEEEVRVFHETYDAVVAEDKVVEQDFNAEFSELPSMMVTRIHKLFKRRPRTQRAGTHAGSNPFKERTLCVPLAPDALGKTLEAMDELDHAEHMPEGMNPLLWEQFCHIRRAKVETEHKVKVASLTLAEKQAFLARRRAEYEEAKEEAKNLYDALESLHDEKFNFLMNLLLHVLLKTNQVEVPMMGLQVDYTDAILLHPSVLQELNAAMRMLGEQRISAMMEYKEVHEIIFRRQCEHKMMDMQIEDQKNMARNVWKLKLFEEEKDYLNERDRESCLSKQVSSLEKTVAFQEKNHRHNMVELTKMRERLIAKAAQKRRENDLIEQELSGLAVTVAERAHIHEAIGKNQSAEKDDCYWGVTENLKSIVKAQEGELAFLAAELKRLMNKNFPKFPELNPE